MGARRLFSFPNLLKF